jgi:MFS family permease
VVFALAGFVGASALARMPSVRAQVGATSAQLSLALVCVGIGSLLAMPLTGRLTERYSSAAVVRAFAVLVLAGWTVAGFLHAVPALAACLLVVGAGYGVWDVAMNVQGHTVEQRRERVLMPLWHAMFSFGSVVGALAGAGAARARVPLHWQFPITGAVAAVVLMTATARFVADRAEHEVLPETAEFSVSAGETGASPLRRGLTRIEILLGLVVLATTLGEGAANDWLGLMLVDNRGLPEAFGGVALAGFNLAMGFGRLASVPAIRSWGRVRVLRTSGATACGGVLLLCLVDTPATALVGALAWGLGLAVVFPSGMSAAGEIEGRGARAIASVSTIGYGGFLFGAPLIGQLTRAVPLDRALLVVAAMALLIVVLAPVARPRRAAVRTIAP